MTAQVTIHVGNILHQTDCDALVNSANERLRAGSGVCGAIHGAAGPELEACSSKLAPLALSAAVITRGFRLPNPWVIHVRGPKYLFDDDPPAALALAMRNVIELADTKGLKRIAVPAISTGIFRYPLADAAKVLVATAESCAAVCVNLEEVRFVLVTEKAATEFLSVVTD